MSFVRRRLDGTNETDPWGLDADLVALLAPLVERLPLELPVPVPDGAVLLVTRRRVRTAAAAVRATGRPVRVLGIPDVEPVAGLLRRLGGAVAHPAEAAGLLRAGHLVVAGPDEAVLTAASATGAAIVPVGDDMGISDRWVTSAADAVHVHGTRDPDPLRGHGSRRR